MASVEGRGAAPKRRVISLRVRITAAASLVVAVALVAGAVLFASVLRSSLVDGVTASAEAYAATLAETADTSGISALDADDDNDRFFQVLDDDGRIVAASNDAENLEAVSEDAYD